MKRHEVLEKKLAESFDWTIQYHDRCWQKLAKQLEQADSRKAELRSEQIDWAIEQAVLRHLELGPVENLGTKLDTGVNHAVEYYYGIWWQHHHDDRYFLDKPADYPVQGWYQTLFHGVLLADWTDRWDDGLRLLDWVDADVARGVQHGDPYLNYSLYVVSTLHRRLPNHQQLIELIQKEGNAFERLLASTCESIAEADPVGFAKNLSKAVKKFHRSIAEDVPNPVFWLSLDLSLLWSIATRSGLQLPDLTPQEDATIVRRETILGDGA